MTRLISLALLFLFCFCCNPKTENKGRYVSNKPAIAVVNYPLYYFAKSIVGDLASVYLPSIGGDPAYWKPSAKQVINFQNSDLILANGAGYSKWLERVSLPSSKIVNTSKNFRDQWIETDEIMVHSHGPEGDHSHKDTAITTWVNFKFAQQQAASIHAAVTKLLSDNDEILNANFEALKVQLNQLDEKMVSISLKFSDQVLVASHPVYQYLEYGYGLNLLSMHWDPNEMPGNDQWHEFSEMIKDSPIKVMLWEDEPLEEIRQKLEELNIKIAVFDPCSNKPYNGNFIEIMDKNLNQLDQCFIAQ